MSQKRNKTRAKKEEIKGDKKLNRKRRKCNKILRKKMKMGKMVTYARSN
jgi:hypothetical protein